MAMILRTGLPLLPLLTLLLVCTTPAFAQLDMRTDSTFFEIKSVENHQPGDSVLIGIGNASEILPSGEFLYVDNSLHVLRHFNEKGELIGQYGRRGRGPGEFMDVHSMYRVHNILYLLDYKNARVVTFNMDSLEFYEINLEKMPVLNAEILVYKNNIHILGSFTDSDHFVHLFDMTGKYIDGFGDFLDYSGYRMNANGKAQITQLHASTDTAGNVLFTTAAPYKMIFYNEAGELIWTYTDPVLPEPWIDHIKVRSNSYRTKFYPMTYFSLIINERLFVVYWFDPDNRRHYLDLRRLVNGELIQRNSLDLSLIPKKFARAGDNEFYLFQKSSGTSEFFMSKLAIKDEFLD